jgi:hypothetical protein
MSPLHGAEDAPLRLGRGDTVVQLHGVGPWQINYLNPADDPRKKPK